MWLEKGQVVRGREEKHRCRQSEWFVYLGGRSTSTVSVVAYLEFIPNTTHSYSYHSLPPRPRMEEVGTKARKEGLSRIERQCGNQTH